MIIGWCFICIFAVLINKETAGKRNQSSEQENQGPETQSDWTILICVFTVLIVIIVVAGIVASFMCLRKKRFSADYIGATMAS
ncbi:uncharacterized protein LOC127161661 isoform X2 [Labeo rohita]|uniref:uncharacterized protein LOC127161661 isoform X2 n=1 Tax=Labeo rohita TaxID=84645 RepID=UPI0021E22F66|nr:uncharacterized protein LOC127161661 isoform X2 [Labeo rohita]